MRRFTTMVALALTVTLVAACGSSGGGSASSGEGQKYVDAIMKNFDKSSSAKDVFTRSQAQCLATGMVNAIGVDTLKSSGVTPDEVGGASDPFKAVGKKLSEQQAKDVVDVITGGKCFNFTDLVLKQVKQSGGSNPFGKLSQDKVKCFFGKLLDNSAFKTAMVNSILGRDSSSDAFSKAFSNQSSVFSILSDCNIRPSEIGAGN